MVGSPRIIARPSPQSLAACLAPIKDKPSADEERPPAPALRARAMAARVEQKDEIGIMHP
jgi:hypothetical protein